MALDRAAVGVGVEVLQEWAEDGKKGGTFASTDHRSYLRCPNRAGLEYVPSVWYRHSIPCERWSVYIDLHSYMRVGGFLGGWFAE